MIVPHLHRLVLANAGYPAAALEKSEVETAARTLGLEVVPFEVRESNNIAPAFEAVKGKAEALFLVGDPLMTANRIRVTSLALAASPADHLCAQRVCRRRRSHVIRSKFSGPVPPLRRKWWTRFLRGTKPRAIFRSSSRLNSSWLSTSRPRGRSASIFPPTLLARADEVIE